MMIVKQKKSLVISLGVFLVLLSGIFYVSRTTALADFVVNAWTGYRLTQGLVGHWTMDGQDIDLSLNTAEVRDISGGGNHGDWRNHASTTAIGKIGQGISLDGINDDIVVPSNSTINGLSVLTACAWVKPQDSAETYFPVFTTHNSGNSSGWDVYLDNNANHASGVGIGTSFLYGASPLFVYEETEDPLIPFGQWSHVCGSQNGDLSSGMKLYINGSEISGSVGGVGSRASAAGNAAYIGMYADGTGQFQSIIDDVRVYSRELSADEVRRLYLMGASMKINATHRNELTQGLVGHWTMDGRDIDWSTGRVSDISGNSNYAAMTGTLSTSSSPNVGKIGQGLRFSGSDAARVDSPTGLNGLTVMTVCAWVNPQDSGENYPNIFSTANVAGTSGWDMYLFNSLNLPTGVGLGTSFTYTGPAYVSEQYEGGAVIPFNEWSHVCVSQNGDLSSSMKLYVNAQELDGYVAGVGARLSDAGNPPMIGMAANGFGDFTGTLDDLRVYNRELSLDEVRRLYLMGASMKVNVSAKDQTSTNGLVGYWTFDGEDIDLSTTTEIRDISGTRNHIDWYDHSTSTVIGKVGQGIDFLQGGFDGARVLTPTSLAELSVFTACAWINPRDGASVSFPVLISTYNSGATTGWDMYIDDNFSSTVGVGLGTSFAYSGGYAIEQVDSAIIPFNQWAHVCVVQNGNLTSAMKLYVNAVEQSGSVSGVGTRSNASGNAAYVGIDAGTTAPYNGKMDDLRVYNRELTSDEIFRIYQMGK